MSVGPSGTVHVIGAGLAGLAAATALAAEGRRVVLYEASPQAGGRARSYFDASLGCRIDNGNHLILAGNRATLAYLRRIGAEATLAGPAAPIFPFHDLETGLAWTLRLSPGRLPWWLLSPRRRVPGTAATAYLRLLRFAHAAPEATVAALAGVDTLARRLILPLAVAALNTPPAEASARLLGAVIAETLLAGGAACRPLLPRVGLSPSLVDPALEFLAARGGEFRPGTRISALLRAAGRVTALGLPGGDIALAPSDRVILATPAPVAAALLPGLTVPDAFQSILNLHFRLKAAPGEAGFIGLVGGTAEWVFVKSEVVSVTISAANGLLDLAPEALAARVWPEVAAALGVAAPMPPFRLVRERRATFAATPAQEKRRPGPRTGLANLTLAGDWTATGLPATLEGAIRSGHRAALLRRAG